MEKIPNINCDLGEGTGNDVLIMPYIHSCNIACGGHYGDEDTIRDTIRLAKAHEVKIGAHPSYPDQLNFGRKTIVMETTKLVQSITQQIDLFLNVCESEHVSIHHVKLHGALYNDAAKDEKIAQLIIDTLCKLKTDFSLYVPYDSAIMRLASGKIPVIVEAFIDRNYEDDLSLVSRSKPNALINTPEQAWSHFKCLLREHKVKTISGRLVDLPADTFCIHGDTKMALSILKYIHKQLHTNA